MSCELDRVDGDLDCLVLEDSVLASLPARWLLLLLVCVLLSEGRK